MGARGVLDGELVEAELVLDLGEQLLARLVEPDPGEVPRDLETLADVVERHVRDASVVGVGDGVDDPAHCT